MLTGLSSNPQSMAGMFGSGERGPVGPVAPEQGMPGAMAGNGMPPEAAAPPQQPPVTEAPPQPQQTGEPEQPSRMLFKVEQVPVFGDDEKSPVISMSHIPSDASVYVPLEGLSDILHFVGPPPTPENPQPKPTGVQTIPGVVARLTHIDLATNEASPPLFIGGPTVSAVTALDGLSRNPQFRGASLADAQRLVRGALHVGTPEHFNPSGQAEGQGMAVVATPGETQYLPIVLDPQTRRLEVATLDEATVAAINAEEKPVSTWLAFNGETLGIMGRETHLKGEPADDHSLIIFETQGAHPTEIGRHPLQSDEMQAVLGKLGLQLNTNVVPAVPTAIFDLDDETPAPGEFWLGKADGSVVVADPEERRRRLGIGRKAPPLGGGQALSFGGLSGGIE